MYKYGILGMGGLGKLHVGNLQILQEERGDLQLCAVAGATAESFKKSVALNLRSVDVSDVDISTCHFYDNYKSLLDNEAVDFVVSALPTFLHEEAAVYALSKGIHVFSEKPMALTEAGAERMLTAARENDAALMIGQCQRFEPAFEQLRNYIVNKTFGDPYRAEFTRYSLLPGWSWNNWLLDPNQSGGCVFDMHIHDVDLINWMFGMPRSLRSAGTNQHAELESIFTQYFYDDCLIISQADWSMPQTFPFEARCLVNFNKATVLVQDEKLTVYQDDRSFSPTLSDESCFLREMRAFLELALDGKPCTVTSPESVLQSVRLGLLEVRSLREQKQYEISDKQG